MKFSGMGRAQQTAAKCSQKLNGCDGERDLGSLLGLE
jgi:hypothetical protein